MKSIQDLVFIILLICCSSKQLGFNKQQVLNAGKDMIQNVKEYINPETTIPKVQVEACVIATNPVIKKAIIIGNACGVPDCKNKTLIDFDQQTIVPSQTVQVPTQEQIPKVPEIQIPITQPETQIPKQEQELKEPEVIIPSQQPKTQPDVTVTEPVEEEIKKQEELLPIEPEEPLVEEETKPTVEEIITPQPQRSSDKAEEMLPPKEEEEPFIEPPSLSK